MSFKGYPLRSAGVSASGTVRASRMYGLSGGAAGPERAADSVNMIRVEKDRVSKRAGFSPVRSSPGPDVGGVFTYYTPETERCFIVAGNTLTVTDGGYAGELDSVVLPQGFDGCSAIQLSDCMVFLNGGCVFIYRVSDGETFYITESGDTGESAPTVYTPVIFIGGSPGAQVQPATEYEAFNLLTPFVSEQFRGDGACADFTVHRDVASALSVSVYLKNAAGEWEYTLPSRVDGNRVTFVQPPPAPAVTGEDNVKITYRRKGFEDVAWKLSLCTCAAAFGVAGYKDRLFISGNDRMPGAVWYSQMDDPLYFPDLNYLKVGTASTRVLGLCGSDTKLAVICRDNVFLMEGAASDATTGASFTVSQILETPPPAQKPCPCVFDGEAVYLTERGVAAIAPSGILDERCCTVRSGLINDRLLKNGVDRLKMTACGDYLVISDCAGTLFLLDSRRFSRDGQNEGFVWTGVPARYLWSQNERLYFSDGAAIYRFPRDFAAAVPVSDVTEQKTVPVSAFWQSPPITLEGFHRRKYFDKLGLFLGGDSECCTGVRISAYFDDDPARLLYDSGSDLCAFRYDAVSFGTFTYSPRAASRYLYLRLLHKRCRAVSLRFENSEPGQTFTTGGYSLDYLIM